MKVQYETIKEKDKIVIICDEVTVEVYEDGKSIVSILDEKWSMSYAYSFDPFYKKGEPWGLAILASIKDYAIVDPRYEMEFNIKSAVDETYRTDYILYPIDLDEYKFWSPRDNNPNIPDIMKPFSSDDYNQTDEISDIMKAFDPDMYGRQAIDYYSDNQDRIQAGQAYPLFAHWFSNTKPEEIDKREPLAPVLEEMGFGKGQLKRLRKLSYSDFKFPIVTQQQGEDVGGVIRADSWYNFIRRLSKLDTAWIPADDHEWNMFRMINYSVLESLEATLGLNWKEMISCSKGRWSEYHKSMARAVKLNPDELNTETLCLLIDDINLFIGDFVYNVMLTQLNEDILDRQYVFSDILKFIHLAAEILTFRQKNPIANLLEYSQRWTIRRPSLESRKIGRQVAISWPQLFSNRTVNGISFQCLTTKKELEDEGSQMRHCVGSYYARCLSGKTHIVKVRSDNGKATLELRLEDGKREVSKGQFKSKSNSVPSDEIKAAGNRLIKEINESDIPCNWEDVENLVANPITIDPRHINNGYMKIRNLIEVPKGKIEENLKEWTEIILPGFNVGIFQKNENFQKLGDTLNER